jgi:hypothetical protein
MPPRREQPPDAGRQAERPCRHFVNALRQRALTI